MKKGFTLVEILVSISILSLIGLLILTVFSSSLRGGNKAQIIMSIKQNGQSVLETMDKAIRGADDVLCTSDNKKNIVIVKDGIYTRYRFIDPSLSSQPYANGLIQQDNPEKQRNTQGVVLETDADLKRRVCTQPNDLMLGAVILTDTDTKTGASIRDGEFTIDDESGFRDVVTIQFNVSAAAEVISGTSSEIDPVKFKTTIQLR